jgi:hypothetical protein
MPSSHVSSGPEKPAHCGIRRRSAKLVHPLPTQLTERPEGHLATFAQHMREGLLAASTAVGLDVFTDLMGSEVQALVGPRGKHSSDRSAYRWGQRGRLGHSGRPPAGGSTTTRSQRRWRGRAGAREL